MKASRSMTPPTEGGVMDQDEWEAFVARMRERARARLAALAPLEDMSRDRVLTRQIVVRLPDDLYALLVADAEANGRTVAQSVRHLLRRHLTEVESEVT